VDYSWIKLVHVGAVVITFALFFVRGVWLLREAPKPVGRWMRILPHANDTVLLGAGIWMAVSIGQYPFVHGWLTAKLCGLLAYIALGFIALHSRRPLGARRVIWVCAQLVFGYIVAVALARDALPWRALG
jgi:uncharacterized membrane protein SirB2